MSKDYPHPFGKKAKQYRKFRSELTTVVSNMARNEFVQNFKRQGYVNKNGVFIPWKATKKKGNRTMGSKSNGILIQSGRLARSLRPEPTKDEARVVSNLPYAKVHNEGFEGTVRVRAHKRNRYGKVEQKYKTRSGNSRTKVVNQKKSDGPVKGHTRKMKIARRPFMITSKTLMNDVEKYAFKELDKIWNNL